MNNNCKRTTHHFLCQTTTRNPAQLYSEHFTISIFIFSIDSLLLYRYFFQAPHKQTFPEFLSKNLIAELFTLDGRQQWSDHSKRQNLSIAQLGKNEGKCIMLLQKTKNKKTPGDKVRSTGITHIGKTKEGNINTCQRGGVI